MSLSPPIIPMPPPPPIPPPMLPEPGIIRPPPCSQASQCSVVSEYRLKNACSQEQTHNEGRKRKERRKDTPPKTHRTSRGGGGARTERREEWAHRSRRHQIRHAIVVAPYHQRIAPPRHPPATTTTCSSSRHVRHTRHCWHRGSFEPPTVLEPDLPPPCRLSLPLTFALGARPCRSVDISPVLNVHVLLGSVRALLRHAVAAAGCGGGGLTSGKRLWEVTREAATPNTWHARLPASMPASQLVCPGLSWRAYGCIHTHDAGVLACCMQLEWLHGRSHRSVHACFGVVWFTYSTSPVSAEPCCPSKSLERQVCTDEYTHLQQIHTHMHKLSNGEEASIYTLVAKGSGCHGQCNEGERTHLGR